MKNSYSILLIALFLWGCNSPKSSIKKDLSKRFTGFEIVGIKKDSSNVFDAMMTHLSLEIRVSESNLEISKALNKIDSTKDKNIQFQNYTKIESLFNGSQKALENFETKRFNRKEACYYVKYLVFKDENKIPKEEYYYINEVNGELLHRPVDWDEFMYELNYKGLIKDALYLYDEVYDLEKKYSKK